jgi:hypothetical protein
MAESTTASQLAEALRQLQAERQGHADAIRAIDQAFEELGISAMPAKRRPGRPKGATKTAAEAKNVAKKAAKRGTGGSSKRTANDFVLGLFTGAKKLTTAQIIAEWRKAERGSKADNTLSKLVGDKKLKREKIKGGQGSWYSLG